MSEPWKEAFDHIHAEEALKLHTKEYLQKKVYRPKKSFRPLYGGLITVFCLMALVIFGGYGLYMTPTAYISIDINPSMELSINRFDKVIAVDGYNDDGNQLAETADVTHMNYLDAVNKIISDEDVSGYLSSDGVLSLTVAGENDSQCQRILSDMEECTSGHENARCHMGNTEEMEAAHGAGLSLGKYRALLRLQELDPQVTAEDVKDMSMREIWNWIDSLAGESESGSQNSGDTTSGNGQHHGEGAGHSHQHDE